MVLPAIEDAGGAQHAVDGRLAGAVAIVEQVLGRRVVDRDHRNAQRAVALHGAQADDAGGRLLHAGAHLGREVGVLRVQQRDQVGAVVHGQHRSFVEHRVQMRVVGLVVLALDREGGNAPRT